MFPQSGDPMETDVHSQSLTEHILRGSLIKEPYLQDLLIELPRREMPHPYSPPSFIFQSPRYKSPLPGSPTVQQLTTTYWHGDGLISSVHLGLGFPIGFYSSNFSKKSFYVFFLSHYLKVSHLIKPINTTCH